MSRTYKRSPTAHGASPLAIPVGDIDARAARERTDPAYGLVAHSTGATLVARAVAADEDPIERAHRYYTGKDYSVQYLIDYHGRIFQYSDDRLRCPHVGVSSGERSRYLSGAWKADDRISDAARAQWLSAWPQYKSPQHLFPSRYPNDCYVGVEMPPCGYYVDGRWQAIAAPHQPGRRFTRAQHVSFALLSIDVAERWGWPDDWWRDPRGGPRSPRIPGHEDLDLYGRSHSAGGWDVGALRTNPWWDWAFVHRVVETALAIRAVTATTTRMGWLFRAGCCTGADATGEPSSRARR